jgi:hypothetical protein
MFFVPLSPSENSFSRILLERDPETRLSEVPVVRNAINNQIITNRLGKNATRALLPISKFGVRNAAILHTKISIAEEEKEVLPFSDEHTPSSFEATRAEITFLSGALSLFYASTEEAAYYMNGNSNAAATRILEGDLAKEMVDAIASAYPNLAFTQAEAAPFGFG